MKLFKRAILTSIIIIILGFCQKNNAESEFKKLFVQMNSSLEKELSSISKASNLEQTLKSMNSFIETMQGLEKSFIDLAEKNQNFDPFLNETLKPLAEQFKKHLEEYAQYSSSANLKYFENDQFKDLLKKIGQVFN